MNKFLLAAAGLITLSSLAVLVPLNAGRAQSPAGKGEIMVPTAPAGSGQPIQPNSTQALFQPTPSGEPDRQYPPTSPGLQSIQPPVQASPGEEQPHVLRDYLNQDIANVEMNNDIAVQPSHGNFMICLNWYSGPDAPQAARDLAMELRGPDYNLKAYVFTKGVEERNAEIARIKEYVKKQQEAWEKLKLDTEPHIRVPVTRYEIQCAVLVGGYKDMESAHNALEKLKTYSADKLKEKNIPLHMVGAMKFDKEGKPSTADLGLVNPFTHALVVANPSIKAPDRPKGKMSPEDLALLRALNENESYSLLKCPKAYTLAVRFFTTPASIESKQSSSSMLQKFGLGSSGDKVDSAAISAHNLATLLNAKLSQSPTLQREKLTAYVLHTKYCSYVTVGAFDDANDQRICFYQEELPKFNTGQYALNPAIQLAAHPRVMPVPR
jgi:hypothetical protein